jgi:hypothetical protein
LKLRRLTASTACQSPTTSSTCRISTNASSARTTTAAPNSACPPTFHAALVHPRRHGHLARLLLHRAGDSAAQQRELRRLHGVRDRVPGHRDPRQGRAQGEARGRAGPDLRRSRARALSQAVRQDHQVLERLREEGRGARATSASSSTRPSARAAPSACMRAAITARSRMLKKDEPTIKRFAKHLDFLQAKLPPTPERFINDRCSVDMMLAERSACSTSAAPVRAWAAAKAPRCA